ncbi:MAG: hypothetical protein NTY53_06910, partial [Kiritimatiellaeota bacterium]|nr:hypothetical protein [Kiritimatiellota bacterium]
LRRPSLPATDHQPPICSQTPVGGVFNPASHTPTKRGVENPAHELSQKDKPVWRIRLTKVRPPAEQFAREIGGRGLPNRLLKTFCKTSFSLSAPRRLRYAPRAFLKGIFYGF